MASSVKTTEQRGGFDCKFTVHPPDALQVDCPICLLVLREPYQISCCGYAFCWTCIERVQLRKTACPTCNVAEFSVFEDKRLKRSLYSYRVHCSHEKDGCQWTGELGELDKHLNEIPKLGEQLSGCEFAEVECIYCACPFQRRYVDIHQAKECPQRPFKCNYCSNYMSTHEDVVINHWPKCNFYPGFSCPNKCGANLEHAHVEHHLSKNCPLAKVRCSFHDYTGCEVQLLRKDMPAHLAENLVAHTAQLVACMKEKLQENNEQLAEKDRQIAALKLELAGKESEIAQLKATQEEDRSSLQSHEGSVPIELSMTDFNKHKRDGGKWYSKPFYTHPKGYKMCLRVDANGNSAGRGTHVSVFANLMRGEFDDHLKWPFLGKVIIRIVNQLQDKEHCERNIDFSKAGSTVTRRVIAKERAKDGWGHYKFLPHRKLDYDSAKNCHFLKDGCLHFQVIQVMM